MPLSVTFCSMEDIIVTRVIAADTITDTAAVDAVDAADDEIICLSLSTFSLPPPPPSPTPSSSLPSPFPSSPSSISSFSSLSSPSSWTLLSTMLHLCANICEIGGFCLD